ncbi:MAG: response regulator [Deltaproteobacteria bacterium]|nr:response regulator [Deltaproteobacteria bacterium]MBW1923127.1 response regulator [Deltaproteobacteria bacterium]MBW1949151.1 response regulator [Deltaproteobacteria bacterium]MBW2007534.1 response regulator [Deltaproteobacteria bacterium]MBW2101536.1 response regulator [Deltaproteobacteria bacterium]
MRVGDCSVLFVDDEIDFLETLLKRMRKRQVEVFGVESGEKALVFLERTSVDVVVLDVKMPGMDGIQTLREIKARYPMIEVIMLTGHASMEAAIEGMELGAFDYLMKPMHIDELLYKLEDACKRKEIQETKIALMNEKAPAPDER